MKGIVMITQDPILKRHIFQEDLWVSSEINKRV